MIIIPARLQSTRFKNKILSDIFGLPMFIATAKNASKIDDVCIAVDDENVYKIAKDYNFKVVMTDIKHQSGTDRINEAVQSLNLNDNEIIINVQADEPFFEIENLKKFKDFSTTSINNGSFMASCYKDISLDESENPNTVKVIIDNDLNAIYFSRAQIPYPRSEYNSYKGHIGIYAYSKKSLNEFCSYKNSELEDIEKLEQLRALQNGKKIAMMKLQTKSIGIDSKEDYHKALKMFNN